MRMAYQILEQRDSAPEHVIDDQSTQYIQTQWICAVYFELEKINAFEVDIAFLAAAIQFATCSVLEQGVSEKPQQQFDDWQAKMIVTEYRN